MSTVTREATLPVYVWQAPVRAWHWVMVLAFLVLAVTGYLIGAPLRSVPGEASDSFLFGYIRFAHFAAGYVFAVAFVGRVYWAIVGNEYAREIFLVPLYMLRPSWWGGFFRVMLHYLFIRENRDVHVGHNNLAMAAMFFMYVLGAAFLIVTGFALYGEGTGQGSWSFTLFSSWALPLLGGSQAVHTWHHLAMWYVILFALVHLYFVFREDVYSGLTVLHSMVDGYRDRKK